MSQTTPTGAEQPSDTSRREPLPRRPRGALGWAALAIIMALVVVTWRAGGFAHEPRVDRISAGQPIDMGPATFTPEKATARHNHDKTWQVLVIGKCQVREGLPFNLAHLAQEAFAVGSNTRPVLEGENNLLRFEDVEQVIGRDYLAPGLPPMTCALSTKMPAGFKPDKGIRLAVSRLEFGDNTVTKNQEARWNPGDEVSLVTLGVEVSKS